MPVETQITIKFPIADAAQFDESQFKAAVLATLPAGTSANDVTITSKFTVKAVMSFAAEVDESKLITSLANLAGVEESAVTVVKQTAARRLGGRFLSDTSEVKYDTTVATTEKSGVADIASKVGNSSVVNTQLTTDGVDAVATVGTVAVEVEAVVTVSDTSGDSTPITVDNTALATEIQQKIPNAVDDGFAVESEVTSSGTPATPSPTPPATEEPSSSNGATRAFAILGLAVPLFALSV